MTQSADTETPKALGKVHWWVKVLIPPPQYGETKAQKAGETDSNTVVGNQAGSQHFWLLIPSLNHQNQIQFQRQGVKVRRPDLLFCQKQCCPSRVGSLNSIFIAPAFSPFFPVGFRKPGRLRQGLVDNSNGNSWLGWWLVVWWAALQVFMLALRHLASVGCHCSPSKWLFERTGPPRTPRVMADK